MLLRRNRTHEELVDRIGEKKKRTAERAKLKRRNAPTDMTDMPQDSVIVEEENSVYDPSLYDPYNLPPYEIYEPLDYRDGPEGFIKWCEDKVSIPVYPEGSDIPIWTPVRNLSSEIHPKSGKSYDHIWQMQKEVMRQALRMVKGRFVYKLIILSWMRGEGKSLLACLIQLWKFFNWPKQQIVLGANSKDQVKFVHFDVMKDIIKNSPPLLEVIGDRNIQEKEIRLRDPKGDVSSVLKPLSSFSGIVSNITGYTFSEMFDMKNPRFFTQLDGSMRNVPNALGVIDSTVSPKTHVLYKMYLSYTKREIKTLFYSYRCSKDARVEDYWNPQMDQQQLDDYRAKFPLGDFEKYFMNVWGSNAQQVFTEGMIEAMGYLGLNGKIAPMSELNGIIERKVKLKERIDDYMAKGKNYDFENELSEIKELNDKLYPVERIYKLKDAFGQTRPATMADLDELTEIYDTNWVVLAGIDRADPLKRDKTAARTIVTIVAKGLPGSRSNPFLADNGNPQYMYVILNIAHIADSLLEGIKDTILEAHETYAGVNAICGERWGIWDMAAWCEEHDISFEPLHPSYDKQKAAFSEIHGAVSTGRLKCPPLAVWGSSSEDILREEMAIFYHDEDKRWFGSPEKMEKYGVQDDTMFSLAWCVYGGRELKLDDMRERNPSPYFGTMIMNRSTLMKH